MVIDRWDQWQRLVSNQAVQREDLARRLTIAGLGTGLDPALWPIIDRFWTLGIRTTGSCAGHPYRDDAGEQRSTTFVAVNFIMDAGTRRRWLRFVSALLAQRPVAGVRLQVESIGVSVTYSRRFGFQRTMTAKWQRALDNLRAALDVAGLSSLAANDIGEPWGGPAPGVPDAVRLPPLNTFEFLHYRHEQDRMALRVVDARLAGQSWDTIAQATSCSVEDARAFWDDHWQGWIAQQDTACSTFPSRGCQEVPRP